MDTTHRNDILDALTKVVAGNRTTIASTETGVFDVESALEAIMDGEVASDDNEGAITDPTEALAYGALMSDGPWWIDTTGTIGVRLRDVLQPDKPILAQGSRKAAWDTLVDAAADEIVPGCTLDELDAAVAAAADLVLAEWKGSSFPRSIGYLAEMCGNDVTAHEAALVRDALIERGLLTWFGDTGGGRLHAMTDDAFGDAVARALTPNADLFDANTADKIGPATTEQIKASLAAGDTGAILVDADGTVVADGSWEAHQPGVRVAYVR